MGGSNTPQSKLLKEKYKGARVATNQQLKLEIIASWKCPWFFNIHAMFVWVNIKYYDHIWVSKWNFHASLGPRLFLCNLISGTNSAVKIHPGLQSAKHIKMCEAKCKIPGLDNRGQLYREELARWEYLTGLAWWPVEEGRHRGQASEDSGGREWHGALRDDKRKEASRDTDCLSQSAFSRLTCIKGVGQWP